MLTILPEVGKETCFALHGGTAINLFVRNMPRLSVDIDLTYLPLQDRTTSIIAINNALARIKKNIETVFTQLRVQHLEIEAKLLISHREASVKIEVNLVKRGCYNEPQISQLCVKAQDDFEVFTEMRLVELGHLFGGKICAALDRQHPRDLFDIKYMLDTEGFTSGIKKGFIFYLISSNRPIGEILFPIYKDQRKAFDNQFAGMTSEEFDYTDYLQTREVLVQTIHTLLTSEDKAFLLSVERGEPDWNIYDFSQFPAVRWKLQNINKLRKQNPNKHKGLCKILESRFSENQGE